MAIPENVLAKLAEYAASIEQSIAAQNANPQSFVELYQAVQMLRGETAIASALVPTPTVPALYREDVTANDVMPAPTLGTATAQSGGSLPASAHHIRVAAVNRYGRTTTSTPPASSPITPSANGAIRIPITVDPLATHYDIFASTAADPLFVARVPAASVTTGATVTVAATASSAGTLTSGTAGTVEVRVAGSGSPAASTVAQNTAYVLPSETLSAEQVPAIDCTGKEIVFFDVAVTIVSRWTEPSVTLIPFFGNATSTTSFAGEPIILSFGGAASGAVGSMRQRIAVNCSGNSSVQLLVQNLTGVGATVNIWQVTR